MTRASPTDIILWLGLAAAWSSSYAVIKVGVQTVDPLILVTGRMIIATVVLLGTFSALGHRLSRHPSDWVSYAVTGMLGSVIPFLLIAYGEQTVDSALAAILMGFTPVATATLAASLLPDERLTAQIVVGLVGALCGVVLLVGPHTLTYLGEQVGGQAAVLAATICYAASTVYIRRYVKRPPLELAAGSSLVGATGLIAAASILGANTDSIEFTTTSLGAIIYLGLISTAAANLIYFYLVPRLGATRMSQVNFAVPVGGALLGLIVLGEALELRQTIALAIIVGSVWIVTTAKQ